jgi:outer membrane protein TolC
MSYRIIHWRPSALLPALLLAAAAAPAVAQVARPGAPLTLEAVHRRLADANPMLAALRAEASAAAFRVAPASALPDPMLEVGTLNRDLGDGLALMPFSGMNMVGLRQMLPLGGVLGSAGRAAAARREAAVAGVAAGELELRTMAVMAFLELWAADRSLGIVLETRDLVRASARAAEAMYRVGRGRQADVLRGQAEVTRMSEEVVRMEAMRRRQVAALGRILDLDLDPDTLSVSDLPLPGAIPGADSLVALALASRPALTAAGARLAAAEAEVDRASGMRWPEVELGVQYGWRPMDGMTDRMLSVMAGISLPVWAGRKQDRMLDEARAMARKDAEERRGLAADTRGAVRAAWERWDEAVRLEALYLGELLPQARAALAAADAAYGVGEVDFMTLLDAQMTLNQLRQEVFRLAAARGNALAELEELTGTALASWPAEEE